MMNTLYSQLLTDTSCGEYIVYLFERNLLLWDRDVYINAQRHISTLLFQAKNLTLKIFEIKPKSEEIVQFYLSTL